MSENEHHVPPTPQKLNKPANQMTKDEWQTILPKEVFHVAREAGTEPPHSSKFVKHCATGKYNCFCCGAELFVSDSKFWSSCGWPAFSKSIDGDKNIVRIEDYSYGMERIEVRCKQFLIWSFSCNAHLGHVFDDGPSELGGERYCINGCTLNFTPEKKN